MNLKRYRSRREISRNHHISYLVASERVRRIRLTTPEDGGPRRAPGRGIPRRGLDMSWAARLGRFLAGGQIVAPRNLAPFRRFIRADLPKGEIMGSGSRPAPEYRIGRRGDAAASPDLAPICNLHLAPAPKAPISRASRNFRPVFRRDFSRVNAPRHGQRPPAVRGSAPDETGAVPASGRSRPRADAG